MFTHFQLATVVRIKGARLLTHVRQSVLVKSQLPQCHEIEEPVPYLHLKSSAVCAAELIIFCECLGIHEHSIFP